MRGERGSVTAEFAVVLPAVLLVLCVVLGAIMLATQRLTLTSAAGELARLEARGSSAAAADRIAALPPETLVARDRQGQLLCITLRSPPAPGPLAMLTVEARGCAAVTEVVGAGAGASIARTSPP